MVRSMEDEQLLRELYTAFNARNVEAVLAALSDDVVWPNAWEGGVVHGRAAVRGYWLRQWAEIDPHVEPIAMTRRDDGRIAVDVHQVVLTIDGDPVGDHRVVHVYAMRDGLVTRMDVEPAAA